METIYKVAGIVIATHRRASGMEQKDMAEKIGMTQSAYSRLETGVCRVQLHHLIKIAGALKIPPLRLIGDIVR